MQALPTASAVSLNFFPLFFFSLAFLSLSLFLPLYRVPDVHRLVPGGTRVTMCPVPSPLDIFLIFPLSQMKLLILTTFVLYAMAQRPRVAVRGEKEIRNGERKIEQGQKVVAKGLADLETARRGWATARTIVCRGPNEARRVAMSQSVLVSSFVPSTPSIPFKYSLCEL